MSRPEPERARPTASAPGARAATRSLTGDADHWVSAPLVRQAIGGWAYAAAAPERRPSEPAVRDAVSVACALHELARDPAASRWEGSAGGGGGRAVRLEPGVLGERAGLEPSAASAGLDLLEQAGALTRRSEAGVATGALAEELLTAQPAVARLAWSEARRRLRAVPGSLAPALAALRELAASLGALAEGETPPPIRLSVRDLEERTGYGRSTVAEALGTLERARVLDVESRAGRTARFTLRPAAFGLPDEAPRAPAGGAPRAESAPIGGTPGVAMPAAGAAGSEAAPGGVSSPAPVLLGHFAGTPIYGPPGTPLVLDRDGAGRWSCRVGPLLTLGPVAAD